MKWWSLLVCLGFIVLLENFNSYGDVIIAGEVLQILTYARHSWPLSSEGSLACHTYCDTGHPFIMVTFTALYDHTKCCILCSLIHKNVFFLVYKLAILLQQSVRGMHSINGFVLELVYFLPFATCTYIYIHTMTTGLLRNVSTRQTRFSKILPKSVSETMLISKRN